MSEETEEGWLLEDTLQMKYISGGLTTVVCPFTTGWRSMPYAMIAQWMHGDIRYERDEQKPLLVKAGATLLSPADVIHCVSIDGADTTLCRWAHIHMTICGGLDVLRLVKAPLVVTGPMASRLGDLCVALSRVRDATDRLRLSQIVQMRCVEYELLKVLLDMTEGEGALAHSTHSIGQVLPVLLFVQEHLTDDIRRDDLAEILHLSPAQFHAVFKKAVGVSPMEYIIRQRIRRAQSLLLQSRNSIAAVAEQSGFRDPFHFSRLFRARCGSSPAKYRRDTTPLPVDRDR